METPEESKKISRQELYDLVWSKPMTALAKEYNISYSELRKIAKKLDITFPQLGHWSKLQHGKKVKTIPLSQDFTGEETITLNKTKKENNVMPTYYKLLQQITTDPSLSFKVPDRLSNPDILITEARNYLDAKKKEERATDRGLLRIASGILNISVAPKNTGRALRFMDKLIKLMRIRGHNIIISGRTTYAVVNDEKINIQFREIIRKVVIKQENRFQYYPTFEASGILSFKIGESTVKYFKDSDSQTVEDQLPKILTKLEFLSSQLKKQSEEREKWHIEFNKKLEAEEAIKKRKTTEIENFKKLLDESERCKKAVDMRNYIKQIENNAIRDNNLSEELYNWIKWAFDKADWYDPLTDKKDDILDF
jgi:hypothetical protein